MNSIEKIYGQVASIGSMNFDTIVVNGNKNPNNDMRRDSMYYRTFESQKYSNISQLDQLDIRYTPYFVVSHSSYDDNNKFIREEVWMNTKNLENFKEFLIYAYEEISNNAEKIYGKGKINPEYNEFIIQTGYNEDGTGFGDIDSFGHVMFIYPTVIVTEDKKNVYNGIALCIENSDGEQFGQEMSINTFYGIVTTLNNYNLLTDSRLVSIEGMLYQILNSSGTTSSSVGSPKRSFSKITPRSRNPIQRRKTLSEALENEDDEEEVKQLSLEDDEEEIETTPKKTISKKKVTKKFSAPIKKTESKAPTISMSDIIEESEDIELDLDDDDEEF